MFGDSVRLIQDEHGLAKRWSAEIARRLEALDQTQRGVILMNECCQDRLANLPQKRPECRVPGKVRAQHNRIAFLLLFHCGANDAQVGPQLWDVAVLPEK